MKLEAIYYINNLGEAYGKHTYDVSELTRAFHRTCPLSTDLYRIEAQIVGQPARSELLLCTEVLHYNFAPKFWNKVYDFFNHTDARVQWESTRRETNVSYRTDTKGKRIPGSEKYGKFHGKVVRQMCFAWVFPVYATNKEILKKKNEVNKLALEVKVGKKCLDAYLVSVI